MNKKHWIYLLLLFVPVLSVQGQGIVDSLFKLQTVEITAARIFKKEEAGMKETKVDSLVLLDKINLSLSEVLSENTTVYIKNYGRGALATASFRGTSPTHTQVSWNGLNINSPMLGMVDFSLIPVYIVDDLSLQHGAASVSEQSGGLGGHISINNTVNWDNRFSGRYYQGIGSYKTFDEFAQINLGNKKMQSKTRVYHNYSKNNYSFLNKQQGDIDTTTGEIINPKTENQDADYSKKGIQQEIYYKPFSNLYTSARVWYQDAYRSIPNVLSYEGSDTTYKKNRQTDQTLKGVVDANYYGESYRLKVKSGVDYQQLSYVLKVKNGSIEEQQPVNSSSNMLSNYNEVRVEYDLSTSILAKASVDVNYFNISTYEATTQLGYEIERMEYSAFGGMYFAVGQRVNLSAELRKDWVPNTNAPLIYNAGISYKPLMAHQWVLKTSFARNFHNPTLNDLYWQPGGNPELLPEKGYTWEGGMQYQINYPNTQLEAQFTAYYSDIDNWIQWLPNIKGYWEAQNLRNVLSRGLEFNAKASLNIRKIMICTQGSYALTRTTSTDPINTLHGTAGNQLPFIPVHTGNALVSVGYQGYYLNYQYHYNGIRNLLNSNYETPDDNFPFYQLYAQHVNGITAGKNMSFKRYKLGTEFKVANLFDESYRNVLNRFMPGRNYTLIIKLSF